MNSIDIILSPALIQVYPSSSTTVYVVIDILRASSTIVAALHNGAHAIIPIEHIEEAEELAKAGHLVGAERNVVRCSFAEFGNDPLEYTPLRVADKEIYLTTTNGTRTLRACMDMGRETVVGAFTNLDAVVDFCKDKDVLAVCAGWKGMVSLEDAMYGAALIDRLSHSHAPASDSGHMMLELYRLHAHDLKGYLMSGDHYPRLVQAHKEDALDYCLQTSIYDILPLAKCREKDNQIALTHFSTRS